MVLIRCKYEKFPCEFLSPQQPFHSLIINILLFLTPSIPKIHKSLSGVQQKEILENLPLPDAGEVTTASNSYRKSGHSLKNEVRGRKRERASWRKERRGRERERERESDINFATTSIIKFCTHFIRCVLLPSSLTRSLRERSRQK